ncbi:MAG: hypothetical protein F7B61_07350 [Caldisphaeraceae archaeon]|nr:hypothetical protein [Caldisphaeraceae archaeon]
MPSATIFDAWRRLVEKYKVGDGIFSKEVLSVPTFPAIANNQGLDDISVDIDYGIVWNCCKIYTLRVNGGGYVTEIPSRPKKDSSFLIELYKPRGLEGSRSVINPLAWNLDLPRLENVPASYIEYGGLRVYFPKAESFSTLIKNEVKVSEVSSEREVTVGPLKVTAREKIRSKGVSVYENEDLILFERGNSFLVVNKHEEFTFTLPYYDLRFSVLYPFRFIPFHLRRVEGIKTNAFSLLNDPGGIGIVSRYGVEISYKPGRLKVISKNPYYIVVGSEHNIFMALLESSILFPEAEPGLFNARKGHATIFISGLDKGSIELLASNPTRFDTTIELVPRFRSEVARVCSYLGCYEILSSNGLYRIPAPSGCFCKVEVEYNKKFSPFLFSRRL